MLRRTDCFWYEPARKSALSQEKCSVSHHMMSRPLSSRTIVNGYQLQEDINCGILVVGIVTPELRA